MDSKSLAREHVVDGVETDCACSYFGKTLTLSYHIQKPKSILGKCEKSSFPKNGFNETALPPQLTRKSLTEVNMIFAKRP